MQQALELKQKMELEKDVQIFKLKTEQKLQEKGKHSDEIFDCLVPEVKNGYFTVYAKLRWA